MAAALASLGVMAVSTSRHRDGRQLLPLAATALVVPLALTWAAVADPGLDRRLTAGVDESSSVQPSRPEFWSVALDMLRDHPLLGVGPDNFRSEFAAYSGVDADNLGIHAHDQYLEALADTGVLGFVTLAWLLTRLVRTSAAGVQRALGQSDWPWRAALLGSLTAWLLHALLDDFERFWPTSVAFWLIAGLTLCAPHTLGARRLEDSAVEQPEDQTNEGDHDQQNQDAGRTRQRGATSAAATEAHHRRALYGSSWPTPRT
jgi:O-antigen ligase